MDKRRRPSYRSSIGYDRPMTKKERESLGKVSTCPPVTKKSVARAIRHYYGEMECATPLYYIKKGSLNALYDTQTPLPYLYQVFDLIGKIGEGSFGVVYKAVSKGDDNVYAVKVSKKPGAREMFNEVKKLEKVGDHPNCVKYFFAWKESGHVFIQLEYCASSLAKYSKYNHKIVEAELWEIFLDMLLALQHLHKKRFVHLDIKPDNILISSDGSYKLGDFGLLVDLLEIKESSEACASKISEGDAKYLAREVLEGNYSPAADIFSLGITILELACDLVLPTNGPLWHTLRSGNIPYNYLGVVPQSLQRAVTCMMTPNFSRRPTVEQILTWRDVTKRLGIRKITPRFNFYMDWIAKREAAGISTPDSEGPIESPLRPLMNLMVKRNLNNNLPARKLAMVSSPEDESDEPDRKHHKSNPTTSRQLNFDIDESDEENEHAKNDDSSIMEVDELKTPSKETNDEDEEPIATPLHEINRDEVVSSTPSRTPPKRVSKVVLYSM